MFLFTVFLLLPELLAHVYDFNSETEIEGGGSKGYVQLRGSQHRKGWLLS